MRQKMIKERSYNADIAGSELSLKIASYPITAHYLANRLAGQGKSICELCCGIGVTLIALARKFEYVIGVDNDPNVINDCRTNLINAAITNYSLFCEDITVPRALKSITADIVLYDIPYWRIMMAKWMRIT